MQIYNTRRKVVTGRDKGLITIIAIVVIIIAIVITGLVLGNQHVSEAPEFFKDKQNNRTIQLEKRNPKLENKINKKDWRSIKANSKKFLSHDKYLTPKVKYISGQDTIEVYLKKSVLKKVNAKNEANNGTLDTLINQQIHTDAKRIKHATHAQQVAIQTANYNKLYVVID